MLASEGGRLIFIPFIKGFKYDEIHILNTCVIV